MDFKKNEINKSEIELEITVTPDEIKPFIDKTTERLGKTANIAGFRPGKAPLDKVRQHFGEMKLYEQALDDVVTHYYWQIVDQEKINAVGQPQIEIVKFAPGNDFVFKAKIALLPEVKVGKYKDLDIKKNKVEVDKKEIEKVLKDVQEMRAKDVAKDGPAEQGDKVELNFNISLDGNPIENGQAEKYPLVIGQNRMIPGFEENIVGMKAGEDKTFKLKFPENYHDKTVAGKECEFAVKALNVYKRELPELNDELAKGLGAFESLDTLKKQLESNIKMEKEQKEKQRTELEMLEKIVDNTEFSDVPQQLIDTEAHKMMHELQHSITQQGMKWEHYLESINKDEQSLQKEFNTGAEKRVKTSLAMREIGKKENLFVSQEEVEKELKRIGEQYKDNPTVQENLKSDGYKKFVENSLNNEKVLQFLREQNIKEQ